MSLAQGTPPSRACSITPRGWKGSWRTAVPSARPCRQGISNPRWSPSGRFVEASLWPGSRRNMCDVRFQPGVALYLATPLATTGRRNLHDPLKQDSAPWFSPSGNELPDHLPLLLGFLAYLARNGEDGVRRPLSRVRAPGVERLAPAFSARRDSPWKPLSKRRDSCAPQTLPFRRRASHV